MCLCVRNRINKAYCLNHDGNTLSIRSAHGHVHKYPKCLIIKNNKSIRNMELTLREI